VTTTRTEAGLNPRMISISLGTRPNAGSPDIAEDVIVFCA
jgi:hypothetical protein